MFKATILCWLLVGITLVCATKLNKNEFLFRKINKRQASPRGPPPSGGCNPMTFEKAHACCNMTNPFSDATMATCASAQPAMAESKTQGKPKKANNKKGRRHAGEPGHEKHGDHFMCMLKTEGFLKANGDLNIEVLTTKFNAKSSQAWQNEYATALSDCQAQASTVTVPPPPPNMPVDVNPKSMMLLMCLRKNLLMNCPSISINPNDATCSNTLASLSTCNPFVLPPPPPAGVKTADAKTQAKPKAQGRNANKKNG